MVVFEQFCILIVVVVTQIYTCYKIAKNYMHIHTQMNIGLKNGDNSKVYSLINSNMLI